MAIASEHADWHALTPAQREQLARLLPIEARELLSAAEPPGERELAAVHARLAQLWQSISAMAPRWVVQSLDDPAPSFARASEATLLFADVTGFTPLTARLEMFGRVGNEYITRVLNRCFAALVPIAQARDGDLLAFGGDAILVAFDRPGHAAAAAAAAWEMQRAIAALSLADLDLPEPLQLQMKIGLASGPLVLASVGGRARRVALPLGSVLDTTDAIASATAPGGIRLDPRAAAGAAAVADLLPQPDGSALLVGLRDLPAAAPARASAAPPATVGGLAERIGALARYLPQSVLASLVATPQAAPGYGEQRRVVSMFAHLAGLHAVADACWSSDPALVAQAAGLAIGRALELIEGYGGALARVDIYGGGHKLLALFGAPVAHEQDAVRTTLAALALRDGLPGVGAAVAQLLADRAGDLAPASLMVRSGIAAGPVVAGMVGSPLRWEYTVLGDAVNVAARLMGRAGAGELLVSADLAAAAGDRLDAEPRTLELRGRAAPVAAWSVRALRPADQARPGMEPELIGRAAERATLRDLGARLRAGQPGALFVQGEAGIGKSRLVRELPALLGPEVMCIQTGPPGLVPVSFGIFRALIYDLCQAALGGPAPDDPDQLRAAVEAICPGQAAELWPALAVLLGRSAANPAGVGASAEAQQRLLAEAARGLLAGAAARQPLAWVCEDLHDADDASLAVFEQLLAIGWRAPLLVCATIRSSAATAALIQRLAELAGERFGNGAALLRLSGLGHAAGDELLDALLPGLAPAARAALHAHTMGNPLFLQALAQLVIQRRMLAPSSQGWVLSGPLAALDVPRTLRELVAAQVDQLPAEVRRLAQVAAVIAMADRTVPLWLLQRIADEPGAVPPRLGALARAQVIELDGADPAPRYAFRHALYQQAAYDQLLEGERQDLHRRAGLALREQPDRAAASVEALAYHCYEGRSWDLALEYSLAAGRRALQSYANREARRLLRRSLGLARRLGLPRHEAEAREGLGEIYLQHGRYVPAQAQLSRALQNAEHKLGSAESQMRRHRLLAMIAELTGDYATAEKHCRRGLSLSLKPGERELLHLYEQLAVVQMRRGELDTAERTCRVGLEAVTAELVGQPEHAQLLLLLGTFDGQRGNYRSAILVLEQSLAMARELNNLSLMPPILRNLGLCFYYNGQRRLALECYQESLSIDERTNDIVGQLRANDNLGLLYLMSGDYDAALRSFHDCLQRSEPLNMRQVMAGAIDNIGYLHYMRGDYESSQAYLLQARAFWNDLGDTLSLATCLCRLADVALACGQADGALRYAEAALELGQRAGSDSCIASALRVIGEALLLQQRLAEAADALDRAQQVQARVDEPFGQVLLLRASILLARMQHDLRHAAHLAKQALALALSQDIPYLISLVRSIDNGAL